MNNEVKTINGYAIKDETARQNISSIQTNISGLNNSFYDEITYKKERINDTDCYIVEIPKFDNGGNEIIAQVGYDEDLSPLEYAIKNHTSITINGSISVDSDYLVYPIIISNGEIVNDFDDYSSIPNYSYYLGIKENRVLATYPYNTSAQDMLNDGCLQAFLTFGKIVDNGEVVEATYGNALVNNPRMAVGLKSDGTFVIFACDGRIGDNKGLLVSDVSDILIDEDCITAWNLDGGGSTSLIINGSKINRNIDNNGTEDRPMHCTLNFIKSIINEGIGEAFSKIGEEKQNIIQQMFGSFISKNATDISNSDLNDLVGRIIIGYGNDLTNSYKNLVGYFINIPHSLNQYKDLYNIQLFATRDRNYIYMRRMVNGVWTKWEVCSATNKKSFAVGTYSPSADSTYEKLTFTQVQDQTDVIILPNPQPSNDYTTFKIDRVGYCTIKIQGEIEVSDTTGNRFIRLYQNNESAGLNTTSFTATSGRNLVYKEIYFYNDSTSNSYTVGYNGKTTDSFRSFSIIVETD